jgi:hypothetical protein
MQTLQEMKDKQYGEYVEIKDEKELLKITTKEKKVVVHFYHKDFKRCAILDVHLSVIIHRLLFVGHCKKVQVYQVCQNKRGRLPFCCCETSS